MKTILLLIAAYLIAIGTIWTAYESHVANIGVMAWQHEFGEIRGDMNQPSPNDTPPPPADKSAPKTYNF